jgi:hypothetical protein
MRRKNDEAVFQSQVCMMLRACGYTIIEVGKSRGKTRCRSCGTFQYATGWQGNTVGAPDLYVHCKDWPIPIGVGLELKTEKGSVREAQQLIANENMTVICRNIDDVINAMRKVELKFERVCKL